MTRTTPRILACALALIAAPALAGPLATDTTSYQGVWHGSTAFSSGTLVGYIDWAVYDTTHAPAGMAGYARTAGEFIYTYQAYETGTATLSQVSVNLQNPADNIGTFTATGVAGDAPYDATLIPFDSANWSFTGIVQGGSSMGLVFSSPNLPMLDQATTLDDGQVAVVIPVPSPSDMHIPEPGTLTLASCGLVVGALAWLRRRGRGAAV